MRNGVLKTYAKEAKERLKSGYWMEKYQRRDGKAERVLSGEELLKDYYRASKVERRKKSATELEEERLYPVVCEILEEDCGLNPIGRLIDRGFYESLDYEGKQRYVLELSEKYLRLKARYEEERELTKRLQRFVSSEIFPAEK